ncbi:MAG: dTDP-4-dehydrorhamnose 3,5-epimerase [Bdellovibrionales bacterium]|nr:dTDP-4-dehydrorhamnose 3,5-epimerase [Bdellovibrionales bacterium]
MKVEHFDIDGLCLITPRVFEDDRGYFYESFNKNTWESNHLPSTFVQDNQSFSTYGTLRGLHFQLGQHAQAKLVRVVRGEALDVAVDIREDSSTFGKYISVILNDSNHKQLYIPRGFAHGFLALSDQVLLQYKCDNFYHKDSEGSIRFDDPELKIDWGIDLQNINLSSKDNEARTFAQAKESYDLSHWS